MTFEEWMSEKGLSGRKIATQLGIDDSTVSRYRKGLRRPGIRLIRKIAAMTEGAVMPNDWFPLLAGQSDKPIPHRNSGETAR